MCRLPHLTPPPTSCVATPHGLPPSTVYIHRQAFNDVVVLNVRRSSGTAFSPTGTAFSPTSGAGSRSRSHSIASSTNDIAGSGSGSSRSVPPAASGTTPSYSGEHPPHRTGRSHGGLSMRASDDNVDGGCGSNGYLTDDAHRSNGTPPRSGLDHGMGSGEGEGEGRRTTRGSEGYRYRWVRPIIHGTPPVGRLAHAAAVVRVVEDGGVGGPSEQAYMVVFGGVGTGALFNDVHALK